MKSSLRRLYGSICADFSRLGAIHPRNQTPSVGIDSALKALELYAKLSGQLQGPQRNHLHLHGQAVPTREEAVEIACETLACFAPHLLTASPTHQPECEMQSRVRENS